eukprot:GSChrysophyteH2.ASY1.ANO1.1143.1 assembled CDS
MVPKASKGPKRSKVARPKSELPNGLPRNWPDSTQEELDECPVRHIEIGYPQKFSYVDNFVTTSRFSMLNFLPNFFLEEFNPKTKIANVYFLFIAILQAIPAISVTRGVPTTLIPLTFLLIIDGTFLALEDQKRHRADKEANSSSISRFDTYSSQFASCRWRDIEVGDFIQVQSRTMIPADLIIISVAEKGEVPQGKCFVETKSLDGETALKARQALPSTFHSISTVRSLAGIKGHVSMEHPNRSINSFQGIVELESRGSGGVTTEVTKDNVILRGSVLRNSEWIIGLVVNTGSDTKIHMSMSPVEMKVSKLELVMQAEIVKVIGLLIAMCVLGTFGHVMWETSRDVGAHWYLNYTPEPSKNFIFYFFHFLLTNAPIIPVSLYVSIIIARYLQSYFMRNDLEMFHEATGTPMDVKNMNINEQLGQISHVVTDKTGTLTCNVMDFRKMSIHGCSYGAGLSSIARTNWEILEKSQENARARIQNFFRVCAICHDAEIEHDPAMPSSIRLSTSNPDDEALICAADYFGYKFVDRADGKLKYENRYSRQADNTEEIEILHIFEFTSERRRMSVVVREPSGKIVLYMKGAKSAITARLSKSNMAETLKLTEIDYNGFVEEGLRCLYLACATIPKERYDEWLSQFQAARVDLRQVSRMKKGESNHVDDLINDLEGNLTLLGATAIEDRLQFGVGECVEELLAAGMNIWMLTGDAMETAVNSSLAAKLIMPNKHSHHVTFDRKEYKTKLDMRNAFKMHINNFDFALEEDGLATMRPWFLIIDGATLSIALDDKTVDGMRYLLSELSMRCRSDSTVLSIGDGANDMPMIRAANIGIGLLGQEGNQAASVADYGISQFRYLSPLIIKHGQSNYMRLSNLICFVFYKNFLLSLCMYWFNFNCGFTGQNFITEGAIQMYNLFYTSMPILYYASYDMHVSKNTFYRFPQTYRACINSEYFNTRTLWSWMMTAVFDSCVSSIMPVFLLQGLNVADGTLSSMWEAGTLTMTTIVIVVNLKLIFVQNKFHWSHYLFISLGIFAWLLSLYVISIYIPFDWKIYGLFVRIIPSPIFWLTLACTVFIIIGRDVYSCSVERHFNFNAVHIVQEADAAQRKRVLDNQRRGVVADVKGEGGDHGKGDEGDLVEDLEGGFVSSAKITSESEDQRSAKVSASAKDEAEASDKLMDMED